MTAARTGRQAGSGAALVAQLCQDGQVGQAYLLAGPANSAKNDAAAMLARAALGVPEGPDGDGAARAHPDIHRLEPQSTAGYLVGQIREMLDDVQLAPISSQRKAYVLADAQLLTPASANALLKSLEEPPRDTVFILLATSAEAVLPTIVSRCQTIRFAARGESETLADLMGATGQTEQRCRRALGFCPDTQQAAQYLADETKWALRDMALATLDELARRDEVWLMEQAARIVEAAKDATQGLQEAQEREYAQMQEILGSTALKDVAERHKRALTAATRSGIMASLRAQRALLRDALVTQSDPQAPLACDDFPQAVARMSAYPQATLLDCIETVGRAMRRIEKNVLPRLAVEGMLLELKEALQCRS